MAARPWGGLRAVCVLALWAGALMAVSPPFPRLMGRYPNVVDFLALALVPCGALHAAKYTRSRLLLFVYGIAAASPFAVCYPDARSARLRLFGASDGDLLCIVLTVVGLMLAVGWCARFAGTLRWRMDAKARGRMGLCMRCAYNLHGNVSGVCPECGTPIQRGIPKRPNLGHPRCRAIACGGLLFMATLILLVFIRLTGEALAR